MKIKYMAGLLALAVLLTSGLPKAQAHSSNKISDVSGHWAQDVMLEWQEEGLIFEDSNGKLNPDNKVTRAEYITFINRMLKLEDTSKAVEKYRDLELGAWYYKEFAKALSAGYISGSGAVMSPKALISKQEAVVMLSKAIGISSDTADMTILNQAKDADKVAGWAKNAVAAAINGGYVTGNDGKLEPLDIMTRAAAVTMLNRYYANTRTLCFSGSYSLGNVETVEIAGSGITLSDTDVNGNLVIEAAVGNGTVNLDGVTVKKLLKQKSLDTKVTLTNGSSASEIIKPDRWADGSYSGKAYGFKSDIQVEVSVKDGKLANINVKEHGDDKPYFNAAKCVSDRMQSENSTDVDTVSGATFSSRGIINAVKNALETAVTEKGYKIAEAMNGEYKDGTYTGVARGLYAGVHVSAVIKDNRLVDLTLGEHKEDRPYVDQAAEGVIKAILEKQSTEVDTVSSATYSSKGIIEATDYALNLASKNPAAEPEENREAYSLIASYGGEGTADGDSWFYDAEEVTDGYVAAGVTIINGISNAIVAKYDTEGKLIWKELMPDYRFGNIITTSKGLFLTGYNDAKTVSKDGKQESDRNAAAMMISQDGKIIWQKSYGEGSVTAKGKASNDAFNQYWMWAGNAVETGDGTIVAGGMSDASEGVFGASLENHNGVLASIDAATGELVAVKVFGSNEHDMVVSLAETSDGDLIVAGASAGKDFSFMNGGWSKNDWDAKVYIMKVSRDLKNVKWTKLYKTEWESYQLSVVVDASDNIYTAYSYREKTQGVSMVKLNSSGEELWLKDYKYDGDSYVSALAMGADGNPLLTVERYTGEHENQVKFGLLSAINEKDGSVAWDFKFTTNNGALLFNIIPSSDGSILAAGIEQDVMGYYLGDIIKYTHK
ncbi:S-layer family protein [Ruminiclostridium sufflavum DSM 19573]|uniref:S-layer family protein n=1 Tax=Ruminiclostridium sufflavum DSM 19573 TaxID=1121337 RepID=A0A318XHM1_9FIRM|nr:FMN-binding protein [Ruminiclostridium sufflavum]PYG86685.1 S-layer family protein [Ruminiclostridium sufflavum DSM 19573]